MPYTIVRPVYFMQKLAEHEGPDRSGTIEPAAYAQHQIATGRRQ
jgi:hypothetical protein